jgi:hypothetical protein
VKKQFTETVEQEKKYVPQQEEGYPSNKKEPDLSKEML